MPGGDKSHTLLCIVCPEGCEIEARESGGDFVFAEGICRRGQEYARREIVDPARILTTTIPVLNGEISILPVRTASPIPKPRIMAAMAEVKSIRISAPVRLGQTVRENLADTGVPLIAGRTVEAATE